MNNTLALFKDKSLKKPTTFSLTLTPQKKY